MSRDQHDSPHRDKLPGCDGTSASSTSSRGLHDHGHKLGRFSQVGGLRNLRGGAAQRELSQQVKRQLAQCQVGQILKVADHCAEHMTLDGAVAALQTLARDPEFKANGKDRRISSILDIYRKSLVPGRRLDMRQLTTSCWAFARLQVYDGPLLAALQDAVVEKARDMSSQELSSTAWAFARP